MTASTAALTAGYFRTLFDLAAGAEATGRDGGAIALADAFADVHDLARRTCDGRGRLFFVGNGGSAGIASHMAIDFTKNGGLPALALTDGAALTCLGNDLGYENVFARQLEAHARHGDLLVAISSSGRSPNILRAVEAARAAGCAVVTLSGFDAGNPLRTLGDRNFYIASDQYGFVEIGHLALLHAILDLAMGWCGRVHASHHLFVPAE